MNTRTDVPDTPATRLLQQYGVRDRATIRRFAAAALADIERAERRRAELGYSPGLIPKILADGGVVWKTCGKRVENAPYPPPLNDEDAWRDRYIGGALGRYIVGWDRDDGPPADADDMPSDDTPEPVQEHCDAEQTLIDGSMPPTLRPLPTPPDRPRGDDDPDLRTYRTYGALPPWALEEGAP
jgi:hypothetical protein